MLLIATEIIELAAGTDYSPYFVSTDRRRPSTERTSLGYFDVRESEGNGPIFRLDFAYIDESNVNTGTTFVKLFGLDALDIETSRTLLYPLTYFYKNGPSTLSRLDIFLKAFVFCDSNGNPINIDPTYYKIAGHKLKTIPNGLV